MPGKGGLCSDPWYLGVHFLVDLIVVKGLPHDFNVSSFTPKSCINSTTSKPVEH